MRTIFQKKWIFCILQLGVFLFYTFTYFKYPLESRNHFESLKWIYLTLSIFIGLIAFSILGKNQPNKKIAIFSKHPFVFLFLPLFIFYSSSKILLSSLDTHPTKLLPFSIHYNSNLLLDPWIDNPESINFQPDKYFALPTSNGYLSAYPILPAIMNYFVLEFLNLLSIQIPNLDEINIEKPNSGNIFIHMLEKYSASFYSSITSVLFYIFLNRRYSSRTSLLSFFLYSFATSHYSNSSQTLWQHGFVELFLIASLLLPNIGKGFLLSLLFLIRPNSLILGIPILIIDSPNKKSIIIRSISFVLGLLFGLSLNEYMYGHLMGGYPLIIKYLFAHSFWNTNLNQVIIALYGIILSPAYGVLIFSPIFLMVFYSFSKLKSIHRCLFSSIEIVFTRNKIQYALSWLALFSYIIFYSFSLTWHGGFSYGNRYLTDANPFLIILLIPSIQILFNKIRMKSKIIKSFSSSVFVVVFIALSVISIYIQNLPTRNIYAFNVWQWEHKDDPMIKKAFDWNNSPIFVEILDVKPMR